MTGYGNTATGTNALSSNTSGAFGAASGVDALSSNTTGQNNTATGAAALGNNTTGSNNIALGFQAGVNLTDGDNNIAIGHVGVAGEANIIRIGTAQTDTYLAGIIHGDGSALTGVASVNLPGTGTNGTDGVILQGGNRLIHSYGVFNFFAGTGAGNFTMDGGSNTVLGGGGALGANTSGSSNTATGGFTLVANTTGNDNTASGEHALFQNTTGSGNIALGHAAGINLTTGNYNIVIGNAGVAEEAETIRIGTGGNQSRAFVAGIAGATTGVNDAVSVVIDSNGQLGTISSSRRYKEDIADMGDTSARLQALRPVTFHYKKPYANGTKPVQYGLIAEEVAATFPELAVLNAAGQPETVKYQDLTPLLLNEVQKLRSEKDELQQESTALRTRLEKLEAAFAEFTK